jgi:hypothetical protein
MQNTNGVYMETQQAVSTRYQTIPVWYHSYHL